MFKANCNTGPLRQKGFIKKVANLKLLLIQRERLYSTKILSTVDTPKSIKEIPGPTKWELFRSLAPGGKFHRPSFTNFVTLLRENYGDIALIPGTFGRTNTLVLHNPEDIEKVFRSGDVWPLKIFFETILYHRQNYQKNEFNNVFGLLPTNNEEWGNFRSLVNPVLMQPKAVTSYIDHMSQVSDEFVQSIKDIRDVSSLEVPADFKKYINYWGVESVTLMLFNKSLGLLKGKPNHEVDIFLHHLENFFEIFADTEIEPPIWKFIATPKFKTLMKSQDVVTEFADKYLQEALENLQNESTKEKTNTVPSMLEQLLKIDPKIARVMAIDTLFAGIDTTTTAFAGLLLCLAKFPEKQAKLREEIMKFLPKKSSSITEENMRDMTYLRACLKESHRMYPVLFGTARTLTKDIVLSDYLIPKDTITILCNFLLLSDPVFYPKPKEFIPERWMREYKNSPEFIGEKNNAFAYFPFGFGARSCVGQRIVNLQMEIGINNLIRNFQIEFNHSVENIFKPASIFIPAKPLLFKFTDL